MSAYPSRHGEALEIAVLDLPPQDDEPEREGTVARLPFAPELLLARDDEDEEHDADEEHELLEADEIEPESESGEWIEADDELLEPSDTIEIEAARSAVRELGTLEEHTVEEPTVDAEAQTVVGLPIDDSEFEDAPTDADERAVVDPIRVPLWSGVNSFAYALSRGLRGMGQSPLVQLLAIGTMAVCMLLLGTATLLLQNAQRIASDLGVDTPVTVYMLPGTDPNAVAELQAKVAELPEVAAVEHVTPEMALARLQDGLGRDSLASVGESERAELLAGIDPNTLPDSLEIALVPGVEPGFADALAGRVAAMDGVEEASALGPWVQQVERMLTTLRWLAFGIAALVSLACMAIVWSTIRLGVFARRSEIEILRLVGGTGRFVRGPFVVEGVLQGVLGTALAIACLWLGFELIRPFLERGLALVFAAGSLRFFTVVEIGLALGFGAVIGLIGSRAAVARHA
ncbi:MAG TPA: permease-like cell division protein FtsX [Enhygromyxa sp.]|nr:permease-like cell division protein FtsX [Enhygromyxa sp.]